jgi:hypothetical protein
MFAALNSFLTRAVSGYFINKSLRFRSSASAYLNRTFGTPTDNKVQTFSFWVKRGAITSAARQVQFTGYDGSSSNNMWISFETNDTFYVATGGALAYEVITTQVFRDPAAWYHFVVAFDTTQATASNRVKIYVNGSQVTAFGTAAYPPQNQILQFAYPNANNKIGTWWNNTVGFFDGEMAEINFVDGQALTPTAFGAFSTYNQWLPIKYAGTYGTNGFYLPFSATSATSYAGSFNGSTQYITAPSNAAFNLGSSDFTIECWIYSTVAGSIQYFAGKSSSAGVANSIIFYKESANTLSLYVKTAGGVDITATSVATIPLNTWTHVAGVRNGATLRIYINGVQDGTNGAISTSAVATTTEVFAVGATGSFATGRWNGSISNFRLVNGTCLYPSGTTFTPSIVPLTAVTNTSLLTLQNSTIVDNSTNAFTITNNGTVVTSVQSPFLVSTVLTADSSGNANNWTPNNISLTAGSTYDSLTDVPTLTSATVANYAVLNPLETLYRAAVISNGNLTYDYPSTGGSNTAPAISTIAISSGTKIYFELVSTTSTYALSPGIRAVGTIATSNQYLGYAATEYTVLPLSGNKISNNVSTAYGTSFTAGDVIGCAVDLVNGKIYWSKNGAWFNSGDPAAGTNPAFTGLSGNYFACVGTEAGGNTCTGSVNFGQQPFTYTPPTGFLALNTFNI